MSREAHCAPAARSDLADSWKHYVAYRASNPLHAQGLPVGSPRNDESDADELIDRMQTAAEQHARHASASAAAGASAAADIDGGQPAASASAPAGEVNGGNAAGQGAGGAAGLG